MGDLISRSAVIDIIHKEIERTLSFAEHETQINIEMAVEELPTAYDVEKVCEQLGEKSFDVEIEDDHIIPESNVKESFNASVIGIETAIDIVRNGGKE